MVPSAGKLVGERGEACRPGQTAIKDGAEQVRESSLHAHEFAQVVPAIDEVTVDSECLVDLLQGSIDEEYVLHNLVAEVVDIQFKLESTSKALDQAVDVEQIIVVVNLGRHRLLESSARRDDLLTWARAVDSGACFHYVLQTSLPSAFMPPG